MKLHFIHDWSPWRLVKDEDGTIVRHKVFANNEDTRPIEIYIEQTRYCEVCNRLETRRIKML